MKYNEAIDMILDGGRMHRNSDKFYYKFSPEGLLHQWWKYKNEVCIETSITRNDCITTDWIVEKDGVVYEEYHPFVGKKEWFKTFREDVSCPYCHSKDLMKVMIKDIESAWYTCTKCQWQGIFVEPPPIIADQVNEDWLEKKMLCFMRQINVIGACHMSAPIDKRFHKEVMGTCCNAECPFCFPQAEPEGTIIPADKVILYTCTHGTYPCEECYEKYKKENHSEQPRDKVTVEEIMNIFDNFSLCIQYWCHLEKSGGTSEKMFNKALECKGKIREKLEYLVSLQGK